MDSEPRFRIRPAGWIDDRQIDQREDVELFARVEDGFVAWRDIAEAFDDPSIPTLTSHQRIATKSFRKDGGHISRWSPEKIEYVMKHGLIVFMECEVRDNVFATIGTVSVLSSTPYTGPAPVPVPVGPPEQGGYRYPRTEYALHPMMPNIDLRDVNPVFTELQPLASKTLYVLRSGVIEDIRKIVLPRSEPPLEYKEAERLKAAGLQRKGYASRGKAEVFGVGEKFGNELVMMNIGMLWDANEPISHFMNRSKLSNVPSSKHNDWLFLFGLRNTQIDRVVPGKIEMYWDAYGAPIDDGIRHMSDTLKKKKWDPDEVKASIERTYDSVRKDIEDGRHAEWGTI